MELKDYLNEIHSQEWCEENLMCPYKERYYKALKYGYELPEEVTTSWVVALLTYSDFVSNQTGFRDAVREYVRSFCRYFRTEVDKKQVGIIEEVFNEQQAVEVE